MSHSIYDPDIHFVINADDRSITNESGSRVTIMQYDHNSERVTFELPRRIENHDMSLCDLVVVLFANTSRGTSISSRSTSSGVYQVTDLATKEGDEDTLICSWLISREATQYKGTLKFQLEFVCHENEETGTPEYNWHTDQCDMIDINPSLDSGNSIADAYPEIIVQMDGRLSVLETNGVPQDRVANAVYEYLTENPIEKLTDEELKAAITQYFVENPIKEGVTTQEMSDTIKSAINLAITFEYRDTIIDYVTESLPNGDEVSY